MDRESLLIILRKIKRLLIKSPKITSTVFLIFIFLILSILAKDSNLQRKVKTAESKIAPSPTLAPKAVIKITSAPVLEKKRLSQDIILNSDRVVSTPTPSKTEIVSNVPKDNLSLLAAVNKFRNANGVAFLNLSDSLCRISEKRLEELIANGSLDNHAGFDKYFKGQTEFKGMGENLHRATYSETGAEIVENGWAKSPGHLANMLDPKWQYGCGGQAGSYFASFIFASK